MGSIVGSPLGPGNVLQCLLLGGGDTEFILQSAGSGSLVPQPANLSGTILVDAQNVSGVATASGSATATVGGLTGRVFNSWANLVAAWGTWMPVFNLATTIAFVSDDSIEEVVWAPIAVGNAARLTLRGAPPATVTAGVILAGTTAKNTAAGTNSFLITNLGGTAAIGQLVRNTTRANSLAFPMLSGGGGSFTMSQPFVPQTIGGTITPAENNAWANGDSVTLLALTQVRIGYLAPIQLEGAPQLEIYQLRIPFAAGSTTVEGNAAGFNVRECVIDTTLDATTGFATGFTVVNCAMSGLVTVQDGSCFFVGGGLSGNAGLNLEGSNIAVLDGDFYVGGGGIAQSGGFTDIGVVGLNGPIIVESGIVQVLTLSYGTAVIYGNANKNVNMRGNSRLHMATGGTYTATFTAPALVTGALINGAGTANSISGGSTINAGITTTPAHFDAAAGAAGFGGTGFAFGGACISATA